MKFAVSLLSCLVIASVALGSVSHSYNTVAVKLEIIVIITFSQKKTE